MSAILLIKQHGKNAEDIAMEKMQRFVEQDDLKGASEWLLIMNAINDLTIRKQQKNLH